MFVEKYDIQSTNEMAFLKKDGNFTWVFDFRPSDLMRQRYCHSGDARMRMQMTSCFFAEALQF